MTLLCSSTWYKAQDLLKIVIRVRKTLYEHRLGPQGISQLKAIYVELGKTQTGCPLSATARFPANLCYVCEANGEWPSLMQQLRLAVCRLTVDQPTTACVDVAFSFRDPEQSLWEATSNVMNAIGNMRDVFVRETVESEMIWRKDKKG
ncbi:hypothetical protein PHYBLDRAFT_151870 [Phycomyces blakesleeanus NRRL 1555(-)]|uniref:Uncharacterized protein n=1 Tax=Phycomyces blakesleeanus (strain ATCC 8743b / DSM 1359 / FGSC 10004 / NBRC 33097 / NRRL 1555) TaxID=763407 RepID=A0A162TGE6_PHYB8|nr:hypothetical protein PHYBLDRAFT_151870 [Phycomyces blakesleeanus NRRL 1555(-)]OAD66933.1 hypothetical protein PHYBLDRAFT_151870 [Phycomyces blakesleeanus NRRL 1555(-)]|eukprot:XP_018284973.1 hypothetical protein PHYBLDRAFT_151870 [Phycomyces blakesleeanus NRRL 1555(-)]